MKRAFLFVSVGIAVILIAVLVVFRLSVIGWFISLKETIQHPSDSPDFATCAVALVEKNLDGLPGKAMPNKSEFFTAEVYSRYPLSDKSSVVISGGSDDGLKPGMPVFVGNYLLGSISSVRRVQSDVETIFSSSWRSSVYIGSSRAKAVLHGGDAPVVELIARDAHVSKGDVVVNSSASAPLSTHLGMLGDVSGGDHDLWFTAPLATPFVFDDVRNVRVLKNFP